MKSYKAREPDIPVELQDPSAAIDLGFPPNADVVAYRPVPCEPFGYPMLTWEDHGMVVDGPLGEWPANVLHHPDGPDRTVQVWRRIIRDPEAGWSLVQSWRPDQGTWEELRGIDLSSIKASSAFHDAQRLLHLVNRMGRPRGTYVLTNLNAIVSAWHLLYEERDQGVDRITQGMMAEYLCVSVRTLQNSLERLELKWRRSGPPIPQS